MNIIFASNEDIESLGKNYLVLELDTLLLPGNKDAVTAWSIIDTSSLTLQELPVIPQFTELHQNLIKNYKLRNWKFCDDALEHLFGRWKGTLDTFYTDIAIRIKQYKVNEPGPEWTGVVVKSVA